eukprot:12508501-Ditylum_brightwellii.AAC.1
MDHPHPPMIMITYTSTAEEIVNNCVKQHRAHIMDMQFYWIRDHIIQDYYLVMWKPEEENLDDYSTNHFPSSHHNKVHRTYQVKEKSGVVLSYIWLPDPKDPAR